MNKSTLRIAIIAIIILGVFVGSYLWKDLSQRPNFSPVAVQKGNIAQTISISGKIAPVDSADLGFESGGKVIKLTHEVGDRVEAGELLAQSNNEDNIAQLNQAVAQRNSALALLRENQQLVDKEKYELKSLKKDNTSNSADKRAQEEQISAQKALVDSQQALVDAANDNVANLEAQLKMTEIHAPFSGIISRQDAEVGEVEQSNVSFMTMISDGRFQVEAYVSEIDVRNIQVEQKAQITTSDEDAKSFVAAVSQIYPAEKDINGVSNYKIILTIDGDVSNLKSGMEANIFLVAQTKNDVLLLPQKAIFQENDKKFVYVSENGLRKKVEIGTGIYGNDSMVEITSGLKQGDEILVVNQ